MYMDVSKLSWMINLAHLKGLVPPMKNGMYDVSGVLKLLQRYKTAISMIKMFTLSTCLSAFLTFSALSYLNFSRIQYFKYGLFWHINLGIIHVFSCAGWIYINSGFFHILCYYYKMRVTSIEKRVTSILQCQNENLDGFKIKIVLKRLNSILTSISNDNKIWQKTNFIFYSFFNLNIGLMINIFIFFKASFFVFWMYFLLVLEDFAVVSVVALSAAQVNHKLKKISKQLYYVSLKRGIKMQMKMKVLN